MPKTSEEEKYRWIRPILEKEISIKQMVKVSPVSERTLKYWLAQYRQGGYAGLIPKSRRPKSSPRDIPIRIKERVKELRQELDLSAMKLYWQLEKEGIHLHPRTIGKYIKQEGLTRKYRIRKIHYHYLKPQWQPGELVEIDVKYVPELIENKRYYQFTAIDCATRWRYLKIYDNLGNHDALDFLKTLRQIAPFYIQAVKTDNGSCFTNRYTGYLKSTDPFHPRWHPFDLLCQSFGMSHYLIDPGKPAQNGKVERSHRTDQEMFYNHFNFHSREDLSYHLRLWNMRYNDLEHCGLNGLTPNQSVRLQVQYVCT